MPTDDLTEQQAARLKDLIYAFEELERKKQARQAIQESEAFKNTCLKQFNEAISQEASQKKLAKDITLAQLKEKFPESFRQETEIELTSESDQELDAISERYIQKFSKEGVYEEGYAAPKRANKGIELKFPSKENAQDFMQEMAKEGHSFSVYSADGKLLAYAKEGELFHPTEKRPFKEGESMFEPPKTPSEKSGASMTRQSGSSEEDEDAEKHRPGGP